LVGLLTSDQIPSGRIIHFGIIADGIHTHPAALRIAHRTHPEGSQYAFIYASIFILYLTRKGTQWAPSDFDEL